MGFEKQNQLQHSRLQRWADDGTCTKKMRLHANVSASRNLCVKIRRTWAIFEHGLAKIMVHCT